MRIAKPLTIWTALVLCLAAFSGCADSPVGPAPVNGSGGGDPSPSPTGPEILVVHPDGTTSWTQLGPGGGYPAGSASGPGSTGRKVEETLLVDGTEGGVLQCGRFYLMVPPGAFDGGGTVTMTMEDSTVMVCDVEINPKELNGFQKPVSLTLCTNGTDASTDTLSIYWYDPDRNDWFDMGCDKDLSDNVEMTAEPYPVNMRGVMTTLSHFSRYSGGKAGW